MRKSILGFLLILTVACAIDIPDFLNVLMKQGSPKCLEETKELVRKLKETKDQQEHDFGNMDILYNQKYMISLISKFKSLSFSVQNSNCSTINFINYFLDGAVFIGDNIYGDSFACLSEEDLEPKFTECSNAMVPNGAEVLEYLKPVSFCVARKTQCSKEDQKSLIVAIHAGVDLYEVFNNAKEILEKMEKEKMKLEFKKEKYEHLLS